MCIELDSSVVLMPGLVDSHVHICEPGNTEWEGFAAATRAAAAGGITTLVDMPLDSVPSTVDVGGPGDQASCGRGTVSRRCRILGRCDPWQPGRSRAAARRRRSRLQVLSADSGSDDFPPVSDRQMEGALGVLRDLGSPLLVHAESAQAAAGIGAATGRSYADYLASRPRGIENLAICQVIEAARRSGGRAHVVHLSSSDALPMIASARREGVALTVETCPHYLILTAEEIADGATAFKCSAAGQGGG